LTGVAVNLTGNPLQVGFVPEAMAMETAAVVIGFTVREMPFDVAGLPEIPGMLDVITHVTIWPFVNVDVNVGEFDPAFTPETFH
jgi:hypothetical protein